MAETRLCTSSSSTTSGTSATRSPCASKASGARSNDLKLGKETGLDLLPRLLAERPGLDVIIITAYATVDTAVEAMRRGAHDYLPKPFTPPQIRHLVDKARERRLLLLRVGELQAATMEEAGRVLGIDASTLWRKRKKWGR